MHSCVVTGWRASKCRSYGRERRPTCRACRVGTDARLTTHLPDSDGMVARGWTCPQGQPTLVEWWEGVRPTRPRIEGSREPTLTKMANQPRHTHGVYAELSSTVPVQHARTSTEWCGAEEAHGGEGHGQLRRRCGGQHIRLRGGASSGAAHDTKPAKQAVQPRWERRSALYTPRRRRHRRCSRYTGSKSQCGTQND